MTIGDQAAALTPAGSAGRQADAGDDDRGRTGAPHNPAVPRTRRPDASRISRPGRGRRGNRPAPSGGGPGEGRPGTGGRRGAGGPHDAGSAMQRAHIDRTRSGAAASSPPGASDRHVVPGEPGRPGHAGHPWRCTLAAPRLRGRTSQARRHGRTAGRRPPQLRAGGPATPTPRLASPAARPGPDTASGYRKPASPTTNRMAAVVAPDRAAWRRALAGPPLGGRTSQAGCRKPDAAAGRPAGGSEPAGPTGHDGRLGPDAAAGRAGRMTQGA